MPKINLSDNAIEIPSDKIGIDMGQSLSKIAYLDNNKLILSSFATHTRLTEIKTLLNAKKDQFRMFILQEEEVLNCIQNIQKTSSQIL